MSGLQDKANAVAAGLTKDKNTAMKLASEVAGVQSGGGFSYAIDKNKKIWKF